MRHGLPSWSAHRNITLAALVELGRALDEELLDHLLEGAVDPRTPKKRVLKMRLAKVLAASISLLLSLLESSFVFLAIPTCAVACAYRPRTYYEAMKVGLMVVKPFGYRPAYA